MKKKFKEKRRSKIEIKKIIIIKHKKERDKVNRNKKKKKRQNWKKKRGESTKKTLPSWSMGKIYRLLMIQSITIHHHRSNGSDEERIDHQQTCNMGPKMPCVGFPKERSVPSGFFPPPFLAFALESLTCRSFFLRCFSVFVHLKFSSSSHHKKKKKKRNYSIEEKETKEEGQKWGITWRRAKKWRRRPRRRLTAGACLDPSMKTLLIFTTRPPIPTNSANPVLYIKIPLSLSLFLSYWIGLEAIKF